MKVPLTFSLLILPISCLLFGCTGDHSALNPAGPQAQHISNLWWQYFWVTIPIYFLTMVFVLLPVRRRRRSEAIVKGDAPIVIAEPKSERRRTIIVGSLLVISACILFYLMIGDFVTARAIGSLGAEQNPLTIKIIGRQWWWEVQYRDGPASNIVTTANEIHIPSGRPIQLQLNSADVIHSFWIPNLHGKKDLIPGHPTTLWLRADQPGTYFGQCAEFCGYQHAHMRLVTVVEPQDKYSAWFKAQQQLAATPQDESSKRGYALFMSMTCVMCHSIDGTPANGMVGPNLTHVASRSRIAANSFPMTRGYLGGWILNPQHLKPGVRMPQHNFTSDELQALLDYLETLK